MSADDKPEPGQTTKTPQGTQDPGELWHVSLNEHASETIIFLHGLGTCYAEWVLVWPHLKSHHLLLPDMNGHRNSAAITPFTIQAQADRVAALIKAHAHGGKAHIVGLSMGGFVAIATAHAYPDLARSVFATGCASFDGWRLWIAQRPNLIGAVFTLGGMMPRRVSRLVDDLSAAWQGFTVPEELRKGAEMNTDPKLFKDVCSDIATLKTGSLKEVKVRTLAVAGGKMDDVPGTKRQAELLKEGCGRSKGVVVRGATHGWSLQFPELFARGVVAWIEERELPVEFEELV